MIEPVLLAGANNTYNAAKYRIKKIDDFQENYSEMQQQQIHNEQAEKCISVIAHLNGLLYRLFSLEWICLHPVYNKLFKFI